MKEKISLLFNIVLSVAVIVLFVLHFRGSEEAEVVNPKQAAAIKTLPIAYVNLDSILANYEWAKDVNADLTARQESSRNTLQKRASKFQKEVGDFQRKVQANSFLSMDRAKQEESRLMKENQSIQELEGRLTEELMAEQQKMGLQLRDTINSFIKEYNKKKKYQVILSNTMNDNVLYAEKGYDITPDILKILNERYKKKD